MRRMIVPAMFQAANAIAAWGQTIEQRAATGPVAGAIMAGPVGAAVGGAADTAVDQAEMPD